MDNELYLKYKIYCKDLEDSAKVINHAKKLKYVYFTLENEDKYIPFFIL